MEHSRSAAPNSPRDWFALAVRLVGLIVGLAALRQLAGLIPLLTDPPFAANPAFPESAMHRMAVASGVTGLLMLVLGGYLLRGAPALVRFCYPESPKAARP